MNVNTKIIFTFSRIETKMISTTVPTTVVRITAKKITYNGSKQP